MQLRWLDLGRSLSQECTALLPRLKNYAITSGSIKTFGQTSTDGMLCQPLEWSQSAPRQFR